METRRYTGRARPRITPLLSSFWTLVPSWHYRTHGLAQHALMSDTLLLLTAVLVCLFVYSFVCFFTRYVTKWCVYDHQTWHRHEPWKPIYFHVKRSRSCGAKTRSVSVFGRNTTLALIILEMANDVCCWVLSASRPHGRCWWLPVSPCMDSLAFSHLRRGLWCSWVRWLHLAVMYIREWYELKCCCSCCRDRVLTALENPENSGIFFNSGKLREIWNTLRKFLKIRWYVSVTQSETHNKPSIDWLCDTLTGAGGAGHHAP